MGAVYKVWDARLACHSALKEMSVAGASTNDPEALKRFEQEARILARLSHHGVPRVTDFFQENGRYYLIQDLIEGETLESVLTRSGGRLLESDVRQIATSLLEILEYLHGQNPQVIHRDIKPANIMLKHGTMQIVLMDFGIARPAHASTGTSIGTEGYAPPEQYRGRAEARSDLYALAATMHHLLSGKTPDVPFSFEPIESLVPNVSEETRRVLKRALLHDVEGRFLSAAEMRTALQSRPTKRNRPSQKAPKSPPPVTSPTKAQQTQFAVQLQSQPHDREQARTHIEQGKQKLGQGDIAGALVELNRSIQLDPAVAAAHLLRGRVKHQNGQLDEALTDYDQALRLEPNNAQIYLHRAAVKQEKGDSAGLFGDTEYATQLDPTLTHAYVLRAAARTQSGQLQEAIVEYGKAIQSAPTESQWYNYRAELRLATDDIAGAKTDCEQSILLSPRDWHAHLLLGEIKRTTGAHVAAELEYDLAISYSPSLTLNPNLVRAYLGRGYIKALNRDFKGARVDYNEALRLDPTNTHLYTARGDVKVAEGDYYSALADYTHAMQLDRKNVRAYIGQGRAKLAIGDIEGAEANNTIVMQLDPGESAGHLLRDEIRLARLAQQPKSAQPSALRSCPNCGERVHVARTRCYFCSHILR